MNWNWKIFRKTSLGVLALATLSGIIAGFVVANKVDEKSTLSVNEKSLIFNGFTHKLTDISDEQIKILANTVGSKEIKPSQVTALTKEMVSRWKINIPRVTFELKDKIDGSSSWTFNDEDGSLSYVIIASKGEESKTFNINLPNGSYLDIISLKIKEWFEKNKDGSKARYPSQRINLQKILFDDNEPPGETIKPAEVPKPNFARLISNFKKEKLTFIPNLDKNLVEIEITKWDSSVWELRGSNKGKLTIKIKLTYNSKNVVYGDFELPFLKDPNVF